MPRESDWRSEIIVSSVVIVFLLESGALFYDIVALR